MKKAPKQKDVKSMFSGFTGEDLTISWLFEANDIHIESSGTLI